MRHSNVPLSGRISFLVLLMCLCAVLLVGCGDKKENIIYVGQSDNWKAILTAVHTPGTDREQQILRLSYKSADIDSVYNVRYQMSGLTQEVNGKEDNMNNKSGIVSRMECTACKLTDENQAFTVTVEWSPNRKETFPLTFIRKE
ncbi:hypothetical protein [Aneurinibacillus sp. REN35]|uniref:hypothetical protein n=1 Tax=Aneurinibacillus sp. REN35 TaxID=3237286 RepID=UPI003527E391